jgi:hypothetical protein
MNKLRTFFRTLFKSLTSPQYYTDVLRAKFSFSLTYFFVLQLFLAGLTTLRILVPVTVFDVPKLANEAVKLYPADLVITAKEGHISINKPLPYAIPLQSEEEMKRKAAVDPYNQGEKAPPANLVVFDSDKNIHGIKDVLDRDAFAVVTETSFYSLRSTSGSEVRSYPIPENLNGTLSVDVVDQLKAKFLNHPVIANKLYVPIIGLFLLILVWPAMIVFRLLTAAVYAVVTFFILQFLPGIWKPLGKLSYQKVLQVSLHSLTLPIVAAYIINWLGYTDVVVGWKYFVLYLIWTLFLFSQATQGMNSPMSPESTAVAAPAPAALAENTHKKKSAKK